MVGSEVAPPKSHAAQWQNASLHERYNKHEQVRWKNDVVYLQFQNIDSH